MQTPTNRFKQAMAQSQAQIGLWLGLANGYSAEILAGTGYDWLLVDGEHAPNDLRSILHQLQAIASATSALPPGMQAPHPIARVPVGDTALIKQYLDIGAQTLLVPMVDTPEQAQQLVRATRYAPEGVRGMGSALARSSRWQAYPQYVHEANQQICLLVQAETVEAMANLDAIAATPGVDGVFIGPADLSASMGHPGNPMCRQPFTTALRASCARARRRASWPPPNRRRANGWRPVRCLWPWAWTPCCW